MVMGVPVPPPRRRGAMLAVLAVLLLVAGTTAFEQPFIVQGTVERVDAGSRNVTVMPSAEYAGGAWTGTTHRPLTGIAPGGADLTALAPGTRVEGASLGSPGGRWTMLAPLAPPFSSTQATRANAVYGDPTFLVSRLPGEIEVQYTTSGACGAPGSPGGATAASITFSIEQGENGEFRTLDLPSGGEGNTSLNGTALRVTFHGGDVSPGPACPTLEGLQPVADFSIVAIGDQPSPQSPPGADGPPGPGEETPGFSALLGLVALGAAGCAISRR